MCKNFFPTTLLNSSVKDIDHNHLFLLLAITISHFQKKEVYIVVYILAMILALIIMMLVIKIKIVVAIRISLINRTIMATRKIANKKINLDCVC